MVNVLGDSVGAGIVSYLSKNDLATLGSPPSSSDNNEEQQQHQQLTVVDGEDEKDSRNGTDAPPPLYAQS
jgi:hypothetical protein